MKCKICSATVRGPAWKMAQHVRKEHPDHIGRNRKNKPSVKEAEVEDPPITLKFNAMFCPGCGDRTKAEYKFCPQCGCHLAGLLVVIDQ